VYPEQRLAHMLHDSGASAVVCTHTEARVRGAGVRCVRVGEAGEQGGGAAARESGEADPALPM
jgi:hypothetical protein